MDAYGLQYAHPLGIGGFAAYLRLKINCLGIFQMFLYKLELVSLDTNSSTNANFH